MNLALNSLHNSDERIKIILADDSEVMRRGIRQLLARQSTIEIVGEAASYAQTIQMASTLRPRLIVLDLHMPDDRDVTPEEVRSCLSCAEILAISVWNDGDTEVRAESLGAKVLLDKANLANTLVPTIVHLCPVTVPQRLADNLFMVAGKTSSVR